MKNVVGIDVAKHELVIYANGSYYSVANNQKSLSEWFKSNKKILSGVDLFSYEPTGGYEKTLANFLTAEGFPGYRAHANHVRFYAKSIGLKAKTDKIDAKVIADYVSMLDAEAQTLVSEHAELRAYVSRREQYLEQIKQEKNRLETLDSKIIKKDIGTHIRYLNRKLELLNQRISAYVNSFPELKKNVELMMSIPGVGEITAVTLLASLPEIFTADEKQLAALAGLAPMNNDSGHTSKKRSIQGGRPQIRRVLYMAAVSASIHNPSISEFYKRLRSKGKLYKVSITAAMRKLLLMIQSVCLRQSPWAQDYNGGSLKTAV